MIKCSKGCILIDGKTSEIFTEITLILERLIKNGTIGIEELFTIFEAISKSLRNDFDKEEK